MTAPLRVSVLQPLIVILAVASPAMSPIVEGSGNDGLLLAGNDTTLWIVRCDPGAKTFDLVAKPTGERWKWVVKGWTGLPVAAAAVSDQLHVFFESRAYLTFLDDGDAMPEIDVKGSPPLAVCQGRGFGAPRGPVVVVVRGDGLPPASAAAQTQPHSPATAPSPSSRTAKLARLVVLRYVPTSTGWQWARLSPDLEVPRLSDETRAMVAAVGEKLYVLTSARPRTPNRLYVWTDGKWRPVPLSGKVAEQMPVAMLAVQQRLLILLAEPVDETPKRRIHIAAPGPDGETFSYQPVAQDGKAREWPASSLPLVGRFGGGETPQLALLWRDGDAIKLAKCAWNGQLKAPEDLDVFDRRPDDAGRKEFQDRLTWGLMIGIFVVMFLLRPQPAPGPFTLPEGFVPGRLWKRIPATLIDLLPFGMLATLIFFHDVLASALKAPDPVGFVRDHFDRMAGRNQTPDVVIYARLLMLGLYTTYSTIMEWRSNATLGKMIFNLRVVGNGAERPTLKQAVVRNLARALMLSWWHFLPLLVLFPLLSGYRQRLGDLFARTAVIDATRSPSGEIPPDDQSAVPPPGPPPPPP